jgi:signal peptidase II
VTGPTSRGRPRWGIFLGLAAAVVIIDRLTKTWLVGQLDPGESMSVIGDLVRLTFVQNSGALFGLFQDSAVVFGLVSLVVVGAIVWYHGSAGRSTLLSVALGLLLGGAIGNLIDRLTLGYVVDFVDVGLGTLRFYTFNVADAAISTALLLLIVSAFLPAVRPAAGAADAADAAGEQGPQTGTGAAHDG